MEYSRLVRASRLFPCAAAVALLAAGCAPPIGVRHLSPEEANHALTGNVLTTKTRSTYSARVLQRLGLTERYDSKPREVLAELHSGLGGFDEDDRLLALSELSFEHALKTDDRGAFIASAAYAWAFLFPDDEHACAGPYEDRLRLAADLYERGIALGLADHDRGKNLDLRSRRVDLSFGDVEIETPAEELVYAGYELHDFVSLADLDVHGFRNRYRHRGIGAALAASVRPVEGREASKWIGPRTKAPVTLVLRFDHPRRALRDGHLHASVELYHSDEADETTVGSQTVPLESDPTAALAYSLAGSPMWDFEVAGFRGGDFAFGRQKKSSNLFFLQPYDPGHIPVVFVHGTASSPARWAEITNELQSDPRVSSRYQFWYYLYNSGNPIAFSAGDLRDALVSAVAELDPDGRDPALQHMVLVGHSQGGLLVKMTVVDSGTQFWDAVSKVPLAEAKMSDESRAKVERTLFVEPLPFVDRVVFIATPHRGSYLTEWRLSNLARRLISMPSNLVHMSDDIARLNSEGAFRQPFRMPTSLDNMNVSNPFLRTLASLPIDGRVKAHSIIPVKGDGDPTKGNDGVVAYESAHIDGVESELVVRWNHSVQAHPQAIEEVRRILYEHLDWTPPPAPPAEVVTSAP